MMEHREYYTNLSRDNVGKYGIILRDTRRAEKMACFLENSICISSHREYTTYLGNLAGEKVVVVSTGIGGPSTAIVIEELNNLGVQTLIRVGAANSLQPYIKNTELIIPSGVVRGGRTALEYVPAEYPASADPKILQMLQISAFDIADKVYTGITHSRDVFCLEDPIKMPDTEKVRDYWKVWYKCNVLCTDMETDTLFVLASIRGIKAGAILSVIAPTMEPAPSKLGIELAMQVATDALKRLILENKVKKDLQKTPPCT